MEQTTCQSRGIPHGDESDQVSNDKIFAGLFGLENEESTNDCMSDAR